MSETLLSILKILYNQQSKQFTRAEIEEQIPRVKKRAILNALSQLIKDKRVEKKGQGALTVYIFSQSYHQELEKRLYIYQNQISIGYLGFDYEQYYFVYDSAYLLSSKYQTSFAMPISTATYSQARCFVDFEELLPEGIDKKILIEKTGNATEFFLLANNNYSANDLIFSKEPLSFDRVIKTESYLLQKEKILGKNRFPKVYEIDIDLDEKSLFPHRYMNDEEIKKVRTMSLSGYQHKLQVILKNGKIQIPKEDEKVEYFIKPYHPQKADPKSAYYFPHIAINEHLHMSFAKNELGFDVPQSGLFKRKEDEEYHYIIKYFDRYKGYKFQRKEFSSYLGLDSENKYRTSSEKLFDMASKVLLREEDRVRMLEYYFYSFVIKHEDMHTKNISTIYDNGKLFLAPLYDIATTGFYNGIQNYESHLPINGKQTNIRPKDFFVLLKKANVPRKVFVKRASFILKTYQEKMPRYIAKISKLEESYFYKKERTNAEHKRIKIKKKMLLQEVMLEAFYRRIEVLKRNLWFEI
jgi:serine/threonine-protein kinase HipA